MYSQDSLDSIQLIVMIVALFGIFIASIYRQYKRRHRGLSLSGGSLLLSYYTEGSTLMPLVSGKIGGMRYSAIATTDAKIMLYRVELPFSTKVHLLSIPKGNHVIQLDPDGPGSLMEIVNLEGDFDSFFSVYAEENEQVQARYVLDPKAMLFTMEFCESHNWEMLDNELYFLQATANNPDDPTDMFDDIVKFVAEIKPALARPLTKAEEANVTPYGVDRRVDLKCPLCEVVMQNKDEYFACPRGHGVLLNGKRLKELHEGKAIQLAPPSDPHTKPRGDLPCPSCGHTMIKTGYNGGPQIIDTCTRCQYRWLDYEEVLKIKPLKSLEGDWNLQL